MGKANVPSAFGLGPASLTPNRPSGGRALPQITFLGSKT
jgi:hypothetical protein